MTQQHKALGRGVESASMAFEEWRANAVLQFFEPFRERRLGGERCPRSFADAACFCQANQRLQVVEP
ncbi:hypothetical protein D3C84_1067960 [compost metagenome]